ncbi:hypothetical protein [Streptomyces sp. NPDC006134]
MVTDLNADLPQCGQRTLPDIVRGHFGGPHVRYILDENPMSF